MSEWRDVPTGEIIAFAEAVKAGDEIEVWTSCGWREWSRDSWVSNWRYRARSKPKTRQVQLRGFLSLDGYTATYVEGSCFYKEAVRAKWPRVTSEDRIVEVEDV